MQLYCVTLLLIFYYRSQPVKCSIRTSIIVAYLVCVCRKLSDNCSTSTSQNLPNTSRCHGITRIVCDNDSCCADTHYAHSACCGSWAKAMTSHDRRFCFTRTATLYACCSNVLVSFRVCAWLVDSFIYIHMPSTVNLLRYSLGDDWFNNYHVNLLLDPLVSFTAASATRRVELGMRPIWNAGYACDACFNDVFDSTRDKTIWQI